MKKQVTVAGFRADELERASQRYQDTEREIAQEPGSEAVLVSVDSLQSYRTTYRNYFLDTRLFIDAVNKAIAD